MLKKLGGGLCAIVWCVCACVRACAPACGRAGGWKVFYIYCVAIFYRIDIIDILFYLLSLY